MTVSARPYQGLAGRRRGLVSPPGVLRGAGPVSLSDRKCAPSGDRRVLRDRSTSGGTIPGRKFVGGRRRPSSRCRQRRPQELWTSRCICGGGAQSPVHHYQLALADRVRPGQPSEPARVCCRGRRCNAEPGSGAPSAVDTSSSDCIDRDLILESGTISANGRRSRAPVPRGTPISFRRPGSDWIDWLSCAVC